MVTHGRSRGVHGRVQHVPLATAWSELAGDPLRQERLLAPLRRAAERSTAVRAIVASGEVFHPVAWTADEAYALLSALPDLEACGIRVRVPDWWHDRRAGFQVRVQLGADDPSVLGLDGLLDFKLGYFLGDEELTPDEWRQLTRAAAGLHRLRGRWIELGPQRTGEALRHWEAVEAAAARGRIDFAEGMRLLAGVPRKAQDEVTRRVDRRAARSLARADAGRPAEPERKRGGRPGPALRGELRPYQKEGVGWLWLVLRLGLGGCLADDMGLGKTIQVVALLLLLRRHGRPGPHLIVLPASLLGNWRGELARFAPDLRVWVAHRSAGDVDDARRCTRSTWC
jgi:non-specific serine/threonine protein kinase